ncbi:MAG: XdhC family protein, partial [Limnohabitans sp.]
MENIDVMVLRTLRNWRQEGKRALLATVVRTWGSSPRPIGSIMALCETGAVVGSVSGGCIEDDLIYRFTQAYAVGQTAQPDQETTIPSGAPQRVKYGITADEAHRFGLPCGGTLELLLEFDPDAPMLDGLVKSLETGQLMQRTTVLGTGDIVLILNPVALAQHLEHHPELLSQYALASSEQHAASSALATPAVRVRTPA